MVGWKMFFLDSTDWGGVAATFPIGSLALLGAGKVFLFALLGKELFSWIFQ